MLVGEGASLSDAMLSVLTLGLRRGHILTMRARGSSMGRTIPDASLVELRPTRFPAGLGDVVAIHTKAGRFLIHRVVGLAADGRVLTMGDAHQHADGWFSPEEVIATVERIDVGDGFQQVPPKRSPPILPPLARRAARRIRRALAGLYVAKGL